MYNTDTKNERQLLLSQICKSNNQIVSNREKLHNLILTLMAIHMFIAISEKLRNFFHQRLFCILGAPISFLNLQSVTIYIVHCTSTCTNCLQFLENICECIFYYLFIFIFDTPLPLYVTQKNIPFLNLRISANHDNRVGILANALVKSF